MPPLIPANGGSFSASNISVASLWKSEEIRIGVSLESEPNSSRTEGSLHTHTYTNTHTHRNSPADTSPPLHTHTIQSTSVADTVCLSVCLISLKCFPSDSVLQYLFYIYIFFIMYLFLSIFFSFFYTCLYFNAWYLRKQLAKRLMSVCPSPFPSHLYIFFLYI